MGIGINAIGNYNPYVAKATSVVRPQQTDVIKQIADELKINNEATKVAITQKEKDFFSQLYPNDKLVMDYHFYQRGGEMSGVSVGSLLDRRG